ncbi:MAG: FapA family protein [Coriobacteriia bacterium]|nr:FapA family protein [Coriobacteriia bacterium]
MTTIKKRLLAFLVGTVLAMAAFVALPATAYAAASIDVSTLDASSVSSPAGDDSWVYAAATRQLRLNQANGDYTITGANSNINIEVTTSATVRFDNVQVTSASDRVTLRVNADTTLYITGACILSSSSWHALQVDAGVELTIGGSGTLVAMTTVNTSAVQNNGTLYIGGTSTLNAASVADCVSCGENSSIWVGSGAILNVEGGWSGLESSHELDLHVDGIANITGMDGAAVYMSGTPVINLIGSGTVSLENNNGSRALSSSVDVYMDEDITLLIANTSTTDGHDYFVRKRDATSTYAWKLTNAQPALGGDIRSRTIRFNINAGATATIQLEPAPVCTIVGTGVGYMTLDDALTAVDNGETINLLANLTLFSTLTVNNGKQFTLDNSGPYPGAANRTLDFAGSYFYIEDGTEVTFNGCSDYLNMPWVAIDYNGTGGSKVVFNGDLVFHNGELWAGNGAEVLVNGNINAANSGVTGLGGASITVTGNVTSGSTGVNADYGSIVEVGGSIESDGLGIHARRNALVTVEGDVKAGENGIDADGGDDADSSVEVTVKGDVFADNLGIYAYQAKVKVEGDVIASKSGLMVFFSKVDITGNVSAGSYTSGDSVLVFDFSDVTIGGNVTGAANTVVIFGSSLNVGGNIVLSGDNSLVGVRAQSDLVVEGNVSTANLDKSTSYALTVEYKSTAWVKGDVVSGTNGILAYDESFVTIDGIIDAPDNYIALGSSIIGSGSIDVKLFSPGDNTSPTTKPGYLTYTDDENFVWVADNSPSGPTDPTKPTTPPTGDAASLLLWLGALFIVLGAGLVRSRRSVKLD